MEGRVKSHISNKTYTTDLEILEEEDIDETSELYLIPISGHKIMVAPGKSIMENGIAYCYVYVIKNDKVLCKLGIYEKKTETMPLFFDISTFPEGSFCLFEEYEKNPSKLVDFEMVEPVVKTATADLRNVFDVLIEEFEKIPNKKERIKSAYKSLFSTYETKKSIEKYKKMKFILKTISDAGKEDEPTDAFIQTLKTNAQDKPVFVMTLLALQRIFFIEFTFVTEYEMADERDEYIKMKEDWPISNATKDLEVDVNTYAVLDPNFIPKNTKEIVEEAEAEDEEAESEAEAEEVDPEPEAEPEDEAEEDAEPESEPEAEPVEEVPEVEPLREALLSKVKPKSRPSTIPENKSLSMNKPETVSKKSTPKILETSTETLSKKKSTTPNKSASVSESLSKKKAESVKSKKNTTPNKPEKTPSKSKPATQAEELKSSKKGSDPTSVIAAAVSKVKASKSETVTPEPSVTLKQNRSIPAVKTKSKPDKVV